LGIYEKLMNIQLELKAPKNQFNKFGNYSYRSCEDILEAVKPLLHQNKTALTISDEIVQIGNRFYVKAVATLTDIEGGQAISASALAREEEIKKGMDASQITGSASSYARKYALNGLFCIDDTKDSDSTNTYVKDENKQQKQGNNTSSGVITKAQAKKIYALANGDVDLCKKIIGKYGYKKSDEVKVSDYEKICKEIETTAKALLEGTPFEE